MTKLNRTILATLVPVLIVGCEASDVGDVMDKTSEVIFEDFIGSLMNGNKYDSDSNSVVVKPSTETEDDSVEVAQEERTVIVTPEATTTVVAEEESVIESDEPNIVVQQESDVVHIEDVTYDEDLPIAEIIANLFAVTENQDEPVAEERSFTVDFDPSMNPRKGWADSYSVGNRCYMHTTFDHGAGDLVVNTPYGEMTVFMVHETIGPGPGIKHAEAIYNDVQCGNGPANNVGDEDVGQCPGRVDQGGAGCGTIHYGWFDYLELESVD